MNRNTRRAQRAVELAASLAVLSLFTTTASAGTYTWNSNTGGTWSLTTAAGWNTSAGDYPRLAGDIAIVNREITSGQNMTLDVSATIGQLTLADITQSSNAWSLNVTNSSVLTFDNGADDALLNVVNLGASTSTINPGMTLSSNLVVTSSYTTPSGNNAGTVSLAGAISGVGKTITFNGPSAATFGTSAVAINGLSRITFNNHAASDINRPITGSGNFTLAQGILNNGVTLGDQTRSTLITPGSFAVDARGNGGVTITQGITAVNLDITGDGLQAKWYRSNDTQGSPNSRNQVTFSGTAGNNFSGNTTVTGAMLALNSASTKIRAAGSLTVSGATIEADDVSGSASSHSVASTTINAGETNFVIRRDNTQTISLNLGTITRGTYGTAVFRYADTPGTLGVNSSITTTNTGTNGLLGGWATFALASTTTNSNNAEDFAGISGGVIGTPSYIGLLAAGGGDGTQNYTLGGNLTLTAPVNGNALKVNNGVSGNVATIATGANNITLTTGGLLVTQTGSNSQVNTVFTGTGTISGPSANSNLYTYIRNNQVTINNPLIGNGSGWLYKSGFGELVVAADAAYSGGTVITGGVLNVAQNANALSSGNLVLTNGGQLGTNGTFDRAIGTGAGQVQFRTGGGGFSAEGGPLTVNLGGTGATLTRSQLNGNLALNNVLWSTHPVTLVNPVDVTGDLTISVGANVNPGHGRFQSNNGVAYSVLQGGTTGTGTLQVYGSSTSGGNPSDSSHGPSGMLVTQGNLNHSGDILIGGASLYVQDISQLANHNVALSFGGSLATSGELTFKQGVGPGEILFLGNTTTRHVGFAAVGGPLTVNIPVTAAVTTISADGLALGNAFSTHTLTYQNDVGANIKALGALPVVLEGRLTGTNITVGGNSPTPGVLISNGANTFTGTLTSSGGIYRAGSAAAYGTAGGGNNGGNNSGGYDLNGFDFSAENFVFGANGSGPAGLGRLFNSNTSSPSAIGNLTLTDLHGGGTYFGGAGDLSLNDITGSHNNGTVAWRGTGTFTIKGTVATTTTGTDRSVGMSLGGGTVVLDYATSTGNKLIRGFTGTGNEVFQLVQTNFTLKGHASSAVTQTIAGAGGTASTLVSNMYGGAIGVKVITRGADLTLNLNAMARNNAAAVDFAVDQTSGGTATITADTRNNNRGMFGGWATWGKTDWARNTTNGTDGAVGAFTAYNDNANASTWAANDNVTNSGTTGFSGTAGTLTIGSLRADAAAASTITVNTGATLTIGDTGTAPASSLAPQTGGILVTPNVGANKTTIAGGSIKAPDNADLVIHQHNASGDLEISSVVTSNSGSGGALVKTGEGKLILKGSNSFYGATRIHGGTVEVSTIGNHDVNQPLGRSGNMYLQGGSTLRLINSGNVSTVKRTYLGIGGATIDASGTGTLTYDLPASHLRSTIGGKLYDASILRENDTDLPDLVLTGSGNAVVNGSIILLSPWNATYEVDKSLVDEALAGVTKNGTGTWTLNNTNYWQGGTVINNGTLALGHATDTLSNNAPVTVNTSGILSIGAAKSDYIGQLRVNGGTVSGAGTLRPLAVLAQAGSISASIDGLLTRLDKTTAGTLAITSANTYSNGTYVQGGTLLVNNTTGSGTGSGKVEVWSGATLGGNGTVAGPTNVLAGGILSPGNSIDSLTVGNLNLSGKLYAESNGDDLADNVNVIGTVTLGAGSSLDFVLSAIPQGTQPFTLISNDGTDAVTGTFATINGAPVAGDGSFFARYGTTDYLFKVQYDGGSGNDVMVVAVPEPGVVLLAGVTTLMSLSLRRRRQVSEE